MTRSLQAQGVMYQSSWIVALAQGPDFTPRVHTGDGRTLVDGNCYSSVEMAIAAGKQLLEQSNKPADGEAFRWIG